ncbi:MAG: cyclic nucleotide-binding domain-containing protein [Rubrivivax sp.]|nr:cyclic nucleotide-binding domain-containing protein [Rubrivivax sp.]
MPTSCAKATGDRAHAIERGRAQVIKRGDGGEHVINQLGAGDSFGEMALFDRVSRSATVRAVGAVRTLVLPLAGIVAQAEARPTLVPVLVDIGALVAERLRQSSARGGGVRPRTGGGAHAFGDGPLHAAADAGLRSYTWLLGTAVQVKEALGRSEFITVPFIVACCAILFVFVRVSGYPARFFGLTLQGAAATCARPCC